MTGDRRALYDRAVGAAGVAETTERNRVGGIVLAGGRSSRMEADKASLEWHGSTLLRRVCEIVARVIDGPLLVVRAAGQPLPALPATVEVCDDEQPGRGPLQGIATGLAAIAGAADVAYVSACDVPLLQPALVRRVIEALAPGVAVAVPSLGGRDHPLAGAYRPEVAAVARELLDRDQRRLGLLLDRVRARRLDRAWLLADEALAEADPELRSLVNLNTRADYERARELPPLVRLVCGERERAVHAATLAEALGWQPPPNVAGWQGAPAAAGWQRPPELRLNGQPVEADPALTLVSGDLLELVEPG